MIVIRVVLKVKPEHLQDFRKLAAVEGAAGRVREGCAEYAFFEDVGDSGRVLLYEEWESDAAFDAYKASPEFADNGKRIFPLLEGKPSSAYYRADKFGPAPA